MGGGQHLVRSRIDAEGLVVLCWTLLYESTKYGKPILRRDGEGGTDDVTYGIPTEAEAEARHRRHEMHSHNREPVFTQHL